MACYRQVWIVSEHQLTNSLGQQPICLPGIKETHPKYCVGYTEQWLCIQSFFHLKRKDLNFSPILKKLLHNVWNTESISISF